MKKQIVIFISMAMLIVNTTGFSQGVGINLSGNSADESSMLDVDSEDKGMLIPRLSKAQRDAIFSPAISLLIYQTDDSPGFYYFNGIDWTAFLSPDYITSTAWLLNGNSGINPSNNFIGTTDALDFIIRTNNTKRIYVKSDGKIGIGTSSPEWKTEIHTTNNAISGNNVDISELALVLSKHNNTNNEAVGIGFQSTETNSVIGAAIIHERVGANSKGGLHFATKKSTNPETTIPIRMTITDSGSIIMPEIYNVLHTQLPATITPVYVGSNGMLGSLASSKKYKNNIKNMENLSWLYNLRPVNFIYKNDTNCIKQYGLIAEEVDVVNPLFTIYNKSGEVNSVNYSFLIAPLLKAVQDQKKQIEILEKDNLSLQKQINEIKTMLNMPISTKVQDNFTKPNKEIPSYNEKEIQEIRKKLKKLSTTK